MTKLKSLERVDEQIRFMREWAAYEQIADLEDSWFCVDEDDEIHNLEYDEFDWRDWLAEGDAQVMRAALHKIASWREGPQVNSTFDEPAAAKVAREALGYGNF